MYNQNPISLYDKKGQRKYLNTAERERFFKAMEHAQIEKRLFYSILFWSGARISEALNLKTNNFDFSEKVVIIECLKKRNKGIYRQIPLPSKCISELKLFTKDSKNNDKIWNWSRRTASRYIKKVMMAAEITGINSSSKGLRHSFAVHCALSKVPLTLIQKWMGHNHLSTTSVYLNVVGEEERIFARDLWKRNSSNI